MTCHELHRVKIIIQSMHIKIWQTEFEAIFSEKAYFLFLLTTPGIID